MRVEYINPFVESAVTVISEVIQEEIKRGQISLKASAIPVSDVAVVIGLAGQVEGRILFDMGMETALDIVSKMNNEQINEFNELARATITELGNMICGRAVTKLADMGFTFDVTPPAVFSGKKMVVSNTEIEALLVPLTMGDKCIEIILFGMCFD